MTVLKEYNLPALKSPYTVHEAQTNYFCPCSCLISYHAIINDLNVFIISLSLIKQKQYKINLPVKQHSIKV